MRFYQWVIISFGLHLLAALADLYFAFIKPHYQDLTAIELLNRFQTQSQPAPPRISDAGSDYKKKAVIETNRKPPAEQDNAGGISGTNYVPSYMADSLPEAISPIEAVYPEEARRQGIEGKVVMQVFIDAGGMVQKVLVVNATAELLAEPARKAVMAVKFRPAIIAGQPRAVVMQLTLKFHLK